MPALPKRNPARRNVSSTKATLSPRSGRIAIPELPLPADDHVWHPLTLAWWRDVWRSPMAPEYDPSDIHGLYVLAMLVNGFWDKPHWTAAAEIRLQRQSFGLSPIDRRRLQWEIEKVDEAQDKGRRRRAASPKADPAVDPRSVLRAV
jgi:hypothetical protein